MIDGNKKYELYDIPHTKHLRSDLLKKYRREGLGDWLHYKDHTAFYHYLNLFTHTIQKLFKSERTINPHEKLTQAIANKLEKAERALFQNMIYSLTLMNHTYRVFTHKGYESTEEDILNAASFLQLKWNAQELLWLKTQFIYWELEIVFQEESFSTTEAMIRLNMNRKTMQRHFRALVNAGKMKDLGVGKGRQKHYELILNQ